MSLAITDQLDAIRTRIGESLLGRPEAVDLALITLMARGHLLIEDVPGVGKTTLANALASLFGLSFSRVQLTSDLLPSDLTGVSVFNPDTRQFEFRKGPVFCNILLADELNRTPPKTQGALLEAMEEKKVSVDGQTRELPDPFFVIATQNPMEQAGTFPLPEGQLDRFLIRLRIGYPPAEVELALLQRGGYGKPPPSLPADVSHADLSALQAQVDRTVINSDVAKYCWQLVEASRRHVAVRLGVSPRGAIALGHAARAAAVLARREYVTPDDVQRVLHPVLAHRLLLQGVEPFSDGHQQDAVIEEILDEIPVPA